TDPLVRRRIDPPEPRTDAENNDGPASSAENDPEQSRQSDARNRGFETRHAEHRRDGEQEDQDTETDNGGADTLEGRSVVVHQPALVSVAHRSSPSVRSMRRSMY